MRLSKGKVRKLLHIHKQTMKTNKGSKNKNGLSSKRGKIRSGTNHKTISSRKSKHLHTKTQKYAIIGGDVKGHTADTLSSLKKKGGAQLDTSTNAQNVGVVEEEFSANQPSAVIKESDLPEVETSVVEQPTDEVSITTAQEPVQEEFAEPVIKEQIDVSIPVAEEPAAVAATEEPAAAAATEEPAAVAATEEPAAVAAEEPAAVAAEEPAAVAAEEPAAVAAEEPAAVQEETEEDRKEREEFEKAKQKTQEAEAAGEMITNDDATNTITKPETHADVRLTKRSDCEFFINPTLREISVVLKEIRDAIRDNKAVDTTEKASPEQPMTPTDAPSNESNAVDTLPPNPIQESSQSEDIPIIPNTNNQNANIGIRELAVNLQKPIIGK